MVKEGARAHSLRPQEYGRRRALYCLSGLGQGSHHSHSLPEIDTWGADLCNPSSKGQCEQQDNFTPTSFKPQSGSSSGIPSAETISFQLETSKTARNRVLVTFIAFIRSPRKDTEAQL